MLLVECLTADAGRVPLDTVADSGTTRCCRKTSGERLQVPNSPGLVVARHMQGWTCKDARLAKGRVDHVE